MFQFVRNHVLPNWKSIIVVLAPLLLLPLPLSRMKEAECGYVILIMAIFWMTEALPLPVTSLIPVVALPLFGIMETSDVSTAYMKDTNMMFIGGLILALAIQFCNLHKRAALAVLLLVGAKPRWLLAGFMGTTAFLSMWISNTATTAMMVPIVDAVAAELYKEDDVEMVRSHSQSTVATNSGSVEELVPSESMETERQLAAVEKEKRRKVRAGIMISTSYSSVIGGTGSLIGSSPQLALKGIVQETFGATEMNFASWMAFTLPGMLINLLFTWIWLQVIFIGLWRETDGGRDKEVIKVIRQKFKDLGPMTFHEIAVLVLFILCVALWFFRDPGFMPGWAQLFGNAEKVDDATAAMLIVVLLFIIPAKPSFRCQEEQPETDGGAHKPSPALLDWKYVQERLPWGVILLLGGGYALSDATKKSGLSNWIGVQLAGMVVLPPFLIMLVVCVITATITEVASNTAVANIFLPILADTAIAIRINPLYFMIPVTATCSYAFMLPVSTPPNAIAFSAAKMKPNEMMKAGWFIKLVCVIVICVTMETWGNVVFGSKHFPEWANVTAIASRT